MLRNGSGTFVSTPSNLSAARIAIGYVVIAGLWIAFSDVLMQKAALNPALATIKGLVFVLVTGGLLYLTIRRLVNTVWSMSRDRDRTERLYRTIVETTGEGVCLLDEVGRIGFLNDRLVAMLGIPADELRGKPFHDLVLGPQPPVSWQEPTGGVAPTPQTCFCRLRTASVKELAVLLSLTPVCDPDTTRNGSLAMILDVSEQKRLEDELRHAQKLEALGRFAGGIVHDFNNLLSIVLGYSTVLNDDLPPDSAARKATGEILRACDRGSMLVGQLLAFSRKQTTTPELVDVCRAVHQFGGMLPRLLGEEVKVKIHCQESAGMIRIGAGQIEQILMNLVTNARDAMPRGGELTISTKDIADSGSLVQVQGLPRGPYAVIEVSDTGSGIAPEIQSHIFEPFFSTKPAGYGTGLGLSTVYGIVGQNGGSISCDSAEGSGTRFTICFPQAVEPVRECAPTAAQPPSLRGNEVVLLAEDEPALRTLTKHILSSQGYTVLEASDGAEAMQILESGKIRIDILLTDVMMPGMGGIVLAQKVGAAYPGTPVLFMSGHADFPDELANGANVIAKPAAPDALLARLRAILDAHSTCAA